MPCTQVCHELLSLDKDLRQHKLIPDQADSLKPFSHLTASTLSFQLLWTGLLQKKKKILIFTSLPTYANWDQLYLQLWSGGLATGVTQGFAILPKFSLSLSWTLSSILMLLLTTAALPSGGNKLVTLYALSTSKCPPAQLQLSTKTIQSDFGWWRSFPKK